MKLLTPAYYSVSVYAFPPLAVGILTAALGLVVLLREKGSKVSAAFFILTCTAAGWLVSYAGIYSTSDAFLAVIWVRLENVAVVFIPTAVYAFSLAVVEKFRRYRVIVFASFMTSVFFAILILFTDEFIIGVYKYFWGYYAHFGPATFPFLAFFSAMLYLSLRAYWLEYVHAPGVTRKRRLKIFLLGFAVSYLASVDYLPAYGIPLYPFGYLPVFAFLIMIAIGIWRYRLVDITPSLAAEQIIKTVADGLVVIDHEGIIRVANEASSGLFGISMKDLINKPASTIAIDFFKKENLARLIWTGTVQRHEITFTHATKGVMILDISSSVIRDQDGHGVAIVCIAKDVTPYKRSAETLREIERHYRLLAENVTDVIWTMDKNLQFTYVSPSVVRLRGYTSEEAALQSLSQTLTPASFQTAMKFFAQVLTTDHPSADFDKAHTLELEYVCKNGLTVWTEVKINFLRNVEARSVEIVGVTREITERKRAQEALQESERCFVDLLQATPEPIITLDRHGYLQSMNFAAETCLGYRSHEVKGQHIAKTGLLAQDFVAKTLQEFTLIILGWQRLPFEVHMVRKDGSPLAMEANPYLIRRDKENVRVQVMLKQIAQPKGMDGQALQA